MTLRASLLLSATLFAATCTGALAQTVSGDAVAIGPDIVQVGNTRIILRGIDAPEANQVCRDSKGTWKCGDTAFAVMDQIAKAAPVTCVLAGPPDPFGRSAGTCRQGDTDIAAELVGKGLALAYPKDPESKNYKDAEAAAKAAKVGLWAAGVTFDLPWVYRMRHNHSPFK